MSEAWKVPAGEIIRPPETAEEKWGETVRLAASLIDNDGIARHDSYAKGRVTNSPVFYEARWHDPQTDELVVLRRWCTWYTPIDIRPLFKYTLLVYEGMNRDQNKPADREYRFVGREKTLEIRNGKTFTPVRELCKNIDDDESVYYEHLYQYFSRSTQVSQLAARRSSFSNRPVQDNDEFARIVLSHAVDCQEEVLRDMNQLSNTEYMGRIHDVAGAVLNAPANETDRERLDVHSSKWRLGQMSVIAAVMQAAGRIAETTGENGESSCKNENAE